MSAIERQAVIEAPLEEVWELVGDTQRYPEKAHRLLIERMDDLHEIRFACQESGMYAHWLLTVQGDRVYFRRWLDQSLDALRSTLAKSG